MTRSADQNPQKLWQLARVQIESRIFHAMPIKEVGWVSQFGLSCFPREA
jgi:hypothetical protein